MLTITDEMIRGAAGCQLSAQQFNVCKAIACTSDNLILSAVAGSGKTYTLQAVIRVIRKLIAGKSVIYVVFSKPAEREAAAKIGSDARVATFHSVGFNAFKNKFGRNVTMEFKKIFNLMDEMDVPWMLRGFVNKLVDYARNKAIGCPNQPSVDDRNAYYEIIDHNGFDSILLEAETELSIEELEELGISYAIDIIKASIKQAYDDLILDFTDQLYMAVYDKGCLATENDKYDFVLIDECQDTSTIRRELAAKLVSKQGRIIAVGDPFQAIYGFTGADNDAVECIETQFNAKTLPLSVSFRCSKAVVRFVQKWVSHIESHPDAIEGAVISATSREILDPAKFTLLANDAIICRNTKPLVEFAYGLLAKGIACQILGKDLANGLVKLVKKWKRIKTIDKLAVKLSDWRSEEIVKLIAKGKEQTADALSDQVDCLLFLMEQLPDDSSVETLATQINSMFVDEKGEIRNVLTLMTCHKSKGLEFNRVFWLGRAKFQPSKYAKKAWQQQQEINLMYVAGTRAKDTLVDVSL